MGVFKSAGKFIKGTVKDGNFLDPAGGAIRSMTGQPTTWRTVLNPGRLNDGVTAGPNDGGLLGGPVLAPPADPNAPGSIFNNGYQPAPPFDASTMPAPGTPTSGGMGTNGLANGTMSGGIDWAPIIARALRK